MITFIVCLVLLVAAYFIYGAYLDRVCQIDTSARCRSKKLYDGVDYVPMPRWRTFLVQLLNIAGIGPIFGAILGACFGPSAFLWITFGGIFMGAMHDFISGVMLVRNDGLSIPEIVGRYLGGGMRQFMRLFSIILLILVGVVFLRSPASILHGLLPDISYLWWIAIIIVYYFMATLLPVDKIIGQLYPLFGFALIFMALGPHGCNLLRGLYRSRDYRSPQFAAQSVGHAHRADALHNDSLRSHFGLPCHAVAADGALCQQRARVPFGVLRGHDCRVDHSVGLGGHSDGFLRRSRRTVAGDGRARK